MAFSIVHVGNQPTKAHLVSSFRALSPAFVLILSLFCWRRGGSRGLHSQNRNQRRRLSTDREPLCAGIGFCSDRFARRWREQSEGAEDDGDDEIPLDSPLLCVCCPPAPSPLQDEARATVPMMSMANPIQSGATRSGQAITSGISNNQTTPIHQLPSFVAIAGNIGHCQAASRVE